MSSVYFRIIARASTARARAPLLERWLARADLTAEVADWRAEAFRLLSPGSADLPAVAPAALQACNIRAAGAWVALATPVHLVAGMSSVSLPADGILELEPADADSLAADFNRVFSADGVRLIRGRGALLLCVFDARLRVDTTPPEAVAGGDIWADLPRGPDSPRVRRVMSEIEMWLFDHAINDRRRARAAPVISGLWLWGGGLAETPSPEVRGWTAGDDPLFACFAPQSDYPGPAHSGVVTVDAWPGTALWSRAEDRWLVPAMRDLKAGRLRTIELSAARRRFSVSPRGLRRFWRRERPWWEAFGVSAPG